MSREELSELSRAVGHADAAVDEDARNKHIADLKSRLDREVAKCASFRVIKSESPGQFLTLPQTAESLGLSEKTIRAQLTAGQITAEWHPCVCAGQVVGRQRMVSQSEVERYRSRSLGARRDGAGGATKKSRK